MRAHGSDLYEPRAGSLTVDRSYRPKTEDLVICLTGTSGGSKRDCSYFGINRRSSCNLA